MRYLDELKLESEKQQMLNRAAEKRAEQLEAIYQERILPKMERLYAYLHEVSTHLNTLGLDIRKSYSLGDLAELKDLLQQDYAIQTDSRERMEEVILSFACVADEPISVAVEGKLNVEKWTRFLQQYHLKSHTKLQLDEKKMVVGAQFNIEQMVPITFKFGVDINNSSINLTIYNFDTLGNRQLQFSPESISEEMLDKMGNYIARKNKSFFDLEMSESERRRLRAKVMYEQNQRQSELLASDNKLHDEHATVKKKGFLGMFRK